MPPPPAARRRGTLAIVLGLVLLMGGAGVSLRWLVCPYFQDDIDACIYVLTARSMLAGEGYSYLDEPFIMRPPGFPVLLMPVLSRVGTHFETLNLYVSLWGVLAVALLYLYLCPRLGAVLSFAISVAVWLNPDFQGLCNTTMSDVPGVAFLLVCLLLERWARRRPSWRRDLVVALAVGLSAYVRTLLGLLAPAIVLSRLLRERPAGGQRWLPFAARRGLLLLVVPVLTLVPWEIRNRRNQPSVPTTQVRIYDYKTSLLHVDKSDPRSRRVPLMRVVERIPRRMMQMTCLLGSRLKSMEPGTGQVVFGVLGLLCLAIVLVRRRRAGDLFAVLAMGLMSIMTDHHNRMTLPVFVMVLPAVAEVLRAVLRRLSGLPIGATLATAAIVAMVGYADFRPRTEWPTLAEKHYNREEACHLLETYLPDDVRLASMDGWGYSVFLDRPVYSLRFVFLRGGIPAVRRLIDRLDIGAVLIRRGGLAKKLTDALVLEHGIMGQVRNMYVIRIKEGEDDGGAP